MINVTKTYLPPLAEYTAYLEQIWDRGIVTNNGPLVLELETKLKEFFDLPCVQFVGNGTIAIQIALKCLNVTEEVITTPFSYVATTTSILWEHCEPVFVDIDPQTFCIDPAKIEEAITPRTKAILATHVYGLPCDVLAIEKIAKKHGLKIIYDAAHAFGCRLKGQSILKFGDLSTLSFHATKVFHTIEGGAIVSDTANLEEKLWLLKSFGHKYDEYYSVGVNGKNSEMHAAMGLCLLPRLQAFIKRRKEISQQYDELLNGINLQRPIHPSDYEYNYSYYPIVFETEQDLVKTRELLLQRGVNSRRYFYPSLNNLPYLQGASCPVSEQIASRVLCLPLFYEMRDAEVQLVASAIRLSITGVELAH